MANFKQETLEHIGDKEIVEYRLRALHKFNNVFIVSGANVKGVKVKGDVIFEGRGNTIPWDRMEEVTHLVNAYDSGFGSDNWAGWITFSDGSWIERATYDGSEWWEAKRLPKLADDPNDHMGEFGDSTYTIVKDSE